MRVFNIEVKMRFKPVWNAKHITFDVRLFAFTKEETYEINLLVFIMYNEIIINDFILMNPQNSTKGSMPFDVVVF